MTRFFRSLSLTILGFLASATLLIAQADQESPFQTNETVTKGEQGVGSIIWIVVGLVILLAIFFLVRNNKSRPTRMGNPK